MTFLSGLWRRRRWLASAVLGLWPWCQPKVIWLLDNVFGNWLTDSVSVSIKWPRWAEMMLVWSATRPVSSVFVLAAVIVSAMAIASRFDVHRGGETLGRLQIGPVSWHLIRQIVQIPDARLATQPSLWAEGLGRWDSFAVHNLWANRPVTRGDFALWRTEFHKWAHDVKTWMETAGCEFLDVKDVAELGRVEGGPFHDDPELNHELVMLDMKRKRIASLIERFRSMPAVSTVRPVVSIEVGPGTARPGDGRLLPSADIRLKNSGDPFTLVVFARLLNVSDGFPGGDEWRYEPRPISGGHDTSGFHIATIGEPVVTTSGVRWLVKLRGEHFQPIRRWEGRNGLQFDVEWLFQIHIDSVNKPLVNVVTRVTLSDDWRSLDVVKLTEEIMPSVFHSSVRT